EVGAGVSAVVADGDALPAVERHGRGADGDVHAVGVAGGGAAVGGDVCADLLRGVPDFEVDEHAVLTAVVFVPDAGDELAAAVAGGLAFDPGDDGDLRVGSADVERGGLGGGGDEVVGGEDAVGAEAQGARAEDALVGEFQRGALGA